MTWRSRSASCVATSAPIPREAPVIRMVLSSSSDGPIARTRSKRHGIGKVVVDRYPAPRLAGSIRDHDGPTGQRNGPLRYTCAQRQWYRCRGGVAELFDAVDEYGIADVDLFAHLLQDPRVGLVADDDSRFDVVVQQSINGVGHHPHRPVV